MNQEVFEKQLYNQSRKYGKQSRETTESILFTVSKDEWNTVSRQKNSVAIY